MDLVLVPFVLPLLLIGRLLDVFESRRLFRAREIDARTWKRTWFWLHGRPRLAEPTAVPQDGRTSDVP
jgi:hypothetical protein